MKPLDEETASFTEIWSGFQGSVHTIMLFKNEKQKYKLKCRNEGKAAL